MRMVIHRLNTQTLPGLMAAKPPNGPGVNRMRPIFAVLSYSLILVSVKLLRRIHSACPRAVAGIDPMSATATTRADAVLAGACPMHNFATAALFSADPTQ